MESVLKLVGQVYLLSILFYVVSLTSILVFLVAGQPQLNKFIARH